MSEIDDEFYFKDDDIQELKELLLKAQKRTSEDMMSKQNPAKSKRLLQKAINMITQSQ